MSDDILLLRLLHIPVIVIKFISKAISMITYLPNYVMIFILDRIIFNIGLQSSLLRYIVFWPFRFLSLNLVTAIFYMEFNAIYQMLDLNEKEWYTQLFALSFGIGAMLFLMRKGYLQMIKKFNPTKLKSPMQHIQVYIQFVIDIVCIVLALFNVLLITNAHKTLAYNYLTQQQLSEHHHQQIKHPFLHHITQLIHKTLIWNMTFFYVNVFFKVFPWRYRNSMEFVQKEKDNLFNLLVLLTLLFLQTLLDVFVVLLLGLFCLMHWKRELFRQRLRAEQRKYMVALQHFWLIIVQLFQIIVTLPCLTVNFTATKNHLTKIIQSDPSDGGQSHQFTPTKFISQTFNHLFCSLMKIPAYFSLVMIFVFRYKHNKYRKIIIHELNGSAKPVSDWEVDKAYMRLFGEQFIDGFYVPFVVFSTVLRSLNIMWIKYVINDKYDLERSMIMNYFVKCVCDIIWWLPLGSALTLIECSYCLNKIITIAKGYYLIYKNQSLLQSITDQSLIKKYTLTLKKMIIIDLPHIPLYLIMSLSLFQLFDKHLQPQTSYSIFQKVIKMFYLHRVKSSVRSDVYFEMFGKDLASGLLENEGHKMRFWKFAHKCQRHIMLTKFLQLLVPKRRYQKKLQQIQKQQNLSQISNEYWYRYNITMKMLQICAYFAIEMIISLIGVLVLAPLTLWRLPTFIIVYRVHNSRRYFFNVLFEVYKLMALDLVYLVFHAIGLLLAPVSYLRFRKETMFKYGNVGYTELLKIEKKKMRFIVRVLIVQTLNIYMLVLAICTIFVWFMRKNMYMTELKRKNLGFSPLIKRLFKGAEVPKFNELIDPKYTFVEVEFGEFEKITGEFFFETIKDIPYLMMSMFIMVVMPWRVFYLKKALKLMKQSSSQRQQVTKVLKNVFKDYLCIFINLILLFSIVKTRKSLQMIRRNYRLNFFVGFLKYSYLKQLIYQLKQAIRIYFSLLLLLICLIVDWQHCGQLFMRVYVHYIQSRQLQQTKRENQRMYTNTIKQNKDIKLFNRLGFFQYVTLCQFLTVKQLAQLARVSKMNYLLLQRQQIWIEKWQNNYSQKYQHTINAQTYKLKCIKAYQLQMHNNKQPQSYTFNQIVRILFIYHVYDTRTDLPEIVYPYVRQSIKQKYLKNYQWNVYEGYGPESQLPQEEDQDEEFLRLTNQIRRQKVQMKPDDKLYFDYAFVRPIQYVSLKIDHFYRVDAKRRLKQIVFIVMVVGVPMLWLRASWVLIGGILQIDKLVGIRIIFTLYVIAFNYLLIQRLKILQRFNWVSLRPFDLYYDVKNLCVAIINFIRIKFLLLKNWINNKVYTPAKTKIVQVGKFLIKWIKKIVNYIVGKAKYVGKTFVDKVAAPLYMYCVHKLIAIKKIVIMIFKAAKTAIEFILNMIKRLIITFYETVKMILGNLNNLYFNTLLHFRKVLMRFGLIGQLAFTLFGLVLMTLPSILCYFFYTERWYIIVSTIHSAVLMVLGYRHLNNIKLQRG